MNDESCRALVACPRDPGDLAPGAALVLWGFRRRAALMLRDVPADGRYYDAFARNGVAAAAFTLDALTCVIGTAALRPVDVRCEACPEVSPDEAALLAACARAAEGDPSAGALEPLLPPAALRFARAHVRGIAAVLAAAGLAWNSFGRPLAPGRRLAPESGI